jgi:ADP-ribose pyrophosphatase YjhB (NUDIX family)
MKGPRLIVRALLVEDGRLLVNQHLLPDRLALFGGRVEKGETLRGALARELLEELGVRVELGPLAYLIENFYVDNRARRIHELGFYFRARALRPLGDKVVPREDWLRPEWLPLSSLAGSPLRPSLLGRELAAGISDELVELREIDRGAFPEVV